MKNKKYNIAIVGATGAVGAAMLAILEERDFPVANLFLLASARSAGKTLAFRNVQHEIKELATFDFKGVDIALFSAGGNISQEYAPIATKAGAVVIDNTSCFRYDEDIPLVIPEVNPEAIEGYKTRGIIANPNCSTIQMLVALKPLHGLACIEELIVSTYQAVSGSGHAAISELVKQTGELLNGRPAEAKVYPQSIAFNVLPHIDVFLENDFTKEEMKMVWETHKILGDKSIKVLPTAVRVPVLYGHSESITIKKKKPLAAAEAKTLLRKSKGIEVIDNPAEIQYPTAFKHAAGSDPVYVGRIRQGGDDPCCLMLWVVADNVRKGAALNAVQIAEILVTSYL